MNHYEVKYIKKTCAASPKEAVEIYTDYLGLESIQLRENDIIEVSNKETKEKFIFKIIRGKVIETHKKSLKLRNKILKVIDLFNRLRTGEHVE